MYARIHILKHQMRLTTRLLEYLETIESVAQFILLFFLIGTFVAIGVLLFVWWALKSRLL